jgi:hypothetical protein
LSILFGGCALEQLERPDDYVVERPIRTIFQEAVPPSCNGPESYASENRFTSIFFDPDLRTFETSVDVDKFVSYQLEAETIGELAYYMTVVHEDMGLDNPDKVYEMLSSGHFIVVSSNEDFAYLFALDDADQFGGFIHIPATSACWPVPETTKWTSVVRANYYALDYVTLVVHEMTHALSIAADGTSDPEHSNELLWLRYGADTLMNKVIVKHETKYNVDDPVNNFEESYNN